MAMLTEEQKQIREITRPLVEKLAYIQANLDILGESIFQLRDSIHNFGEEIKLKHEVNLLAKELKIEIKKETYQKELARAAEELKNAKLGYTEE